MRKIIKYFNSKLELYCFRVYWGTHIRDVNDTCDVVTGHLGLSVTLALGFICLLLSPFIPPINFDELGLADPELRRIVLLGIIGGGAIILIALPIRSYLRKIFTQESVDRIGATKSYTKNQIYLTKLYLTFGMLIPLFIFAVAAILIRDYYWTLPFFQ